MQRTLAYAVCQSPKHLGQHRRADQRLNCRIELRKVHQSHFGLQSRDSHDLDGLGRREPPNHSRGRYSRHVLAINRVSVEGHKYKVRLRCQLLKNALEQLTPLRFVLGLAGRREASNVFLQPKHLHSLVLQVVVVLVGAYRSLACELDEGRVVLDKQFVLQ